MKPNTKKINLLTVSFLTGIAFMIGGFFRSFLELTLAREENFLFIFLAIWVGFIVEAMVGMAVLAGLLQKNYSFKELWLAGVSAFAAGILIPALLINQFFVTLLILPGFLTGLFFSIFLKGFSGRRVLILSITLGFLLCQILIFAVGFDRPWMLWLYENAGPNSVGLLMNAIMNMIIGVSVALGVVLTLRSPGEELV